MKLVYVHQVCSVYVFVSLKLKEQTELEVKKYQQTQTHTPGGIFSMKAFQIIVTSVRSVFKGSV